MHTTIFDVSSIDALGSEYDAAPIVPVDPVVAHQCASLWTQYGTFARARATDLARTYHIDCVEHEKYSTFEELLDDLDQRRYSVTLDYAPHPWWDITTEVAARICHDIDGHHGSRHDFTWNGEVYAVQSQLRHTPHVFWPVVFAQTLHQLASTTENHYFPDQQKVLLTTHEDLRALVYPTGPQSWTDDVPVALTA